MPVTDKLQNVKHFFAVATATQSTEIKV